MSVIYTSGGAATIADATTTTSGKVRLATIAEAAGTSELIAVTPAGLQSEITALASGLVYRGTIDVANFSTLLNASLGDYYKIATGGTAGDGRVYATGDAIIVNADMGGTFSDAKLDKIDNVDPATSDEITGNHTGVNYTAASTDSLTTHLGGIDTELATFATLASPALSGTPTAPTAAGGTNTTQLATTAFVQSAVSGVSAPVDSVNGNTGVVVLSGDDITADHTASNYTAANANIDGHLSGIDTELATFATLASPALSGTPTAPTAAGGTNTTQLATTAFVQTAVSGVSAPVASVNGNTGVVVLSGDDLAADHTASNYTAGNANIDGHLSGIDTELATFATLASPALTGTPTAPTAAGGTNTTQLATTAFVQTAVSGVSAPVDSVNGNTGVVVLSGDDIAADHTASNYTAANANIDGHLSGIDTEIATFATLASPALTGTPTAPTAAGGTNTTQLATTAFVQTAVSGVSAPVDSVNGNTGVVVLSGDDIAADHTASNYTAANANIDGHLSGIDTEIATFATLASPALTGTPTAPTAAGGTNTTQLATTAFVQTAVSGVSGGGWTYSAITADPAPAVTSYHYSCTGTFTITLPAAAAGNQGDEIRIKNMGSGTVTVGRTSGNIDGAAADYTLDTQYSSITLISNGSNGWEVV